MKALLRDQDLDIDGRERLIAEARELIHEEFGLPRDAWAAARSTAFSPT